MLEILTGNLNRHLALATSHNFKIRVFPGFRRNIEFKPQSALFKLKEDSTAH